MLASGKVSASADVLGDEVVRRLRLIETESILLSSVLFNRLFAGLPLSCCCALSTIASDEVSASVSELEGDAFRRLRPTDTLVLISDGLLEPLSSTELSLSLGRGERRRRPVTLAARLSSGLLSSRTFGRAAAWVVVLIIISCNAMPLSWLSHPASSSTRFRSECEFAKKSGA